MKLLYTKSVLGCHMFVKMDYDGPDYTSEWNEILLNYNDKNSSKKEVYEF